MYRTISTVVYVVRARLWPKRDLMGVSDVDAVAKAWPLLRYAVEHHTYERARLHPQRGTGEVAVRVAVDLLRMDDPRTEMAWRAVLSVGEVEACFKHTCPGSVVPPHPG